MLLGRAANGLFWVSRYIERAENMARLVDTGLRLSLTEISTASDEWGSVLSSAGVRGAFEANHSDYSTPAVADFLLRDLSNPSSVLSSMETARMNARMVRTALTREVWEAINEAWMTFRRLLTTPVDERDLPAVLDAIKRETALIRGTFQGTMLRNEIFEFAQLGTLIERADNTARILDVKYFVLLPSAAWVGSVLDTSQWQTILRSVAAHRSYRWTYEGEYSPANVADHLILNRRMPRSLAFSYNGISASLGNLGDDYGVRHKSQELAENILSSLSDSSVEDIVNRGLHEFIRGFIGDNARLADQIATDYRFN